MSGITSAVLFLQKAEASLLPSLASARSCSQRLKDVQQALGSLERDFHAHVSQLQALAPHAPSCFAPEEVQRLQGTVVSRLLVLLAVLQAQAQLRTETLEG